MIDMGTMDAAEPSLRVTQLTLRRVLGGVKARGLLYRLCGDDAVHHEDPVPRCDDREVQRGEDRQCQCTCIHQPQLKGCRRRRPHLAGRGRPSLRSGKCSAGRRTGSIFSDDGRSGNRGGRTIKRALSSTLPTAALRLFPLQVKKSVTSSATAERTMRAGTRSAFRSTPAEE